MQYCSLQHQILLLSLHTSTASIIYFDPSTSFFLGLLVVLLHSSPVAYWTPSDLGSSSFSIMSFCPFTQFMRFSRQVYWGLPFPPPVDHILSELSTMTCPSWVALHGSAHSHIELYKPLCQDKAVICEGAKRTYTWLILGLKFPVLRGSIRRGSKSFSPGCNQEKLQVFLRITESSMVPEQKHSLVEGDAHTDGSCLSPQGGEVSWECQNFLTESQKGWRTWRHLQFGHAGQTAHGPGEQS